MQQRVEISNNPNDIEKRLQAAVVMKRVRIEEFFFDFDKLRRGKVSKNQFEQILSMLNFNLSRDEFDLDFTEEERKMIQDILKEYKEAVRVKRIHLKPMF